MSRQVNIHHWYGVLMLNNLLIHVGYHKTASSYLQHVVFPQLPVNLFNLDEQHLKLIGTDNESDSMLFRDWIESEVSKARSGNNKDITIISHEALSGHPHGYKKISPFLIADNLASTFPGSKILIIIRNQFDYITSLYAFRVATKGEEYKNLDNFVKFAGSKGLFEHLEYHLLIEKYQALFGEKNVLVLPMEILIKSPNEYIERIISFIGISELKPHIGKPVNVSTKVSLILNFWRPINFLVYYLIRLIMLVFGKTKKDVRGLTYRFHRLKHKATVVLIRLFRKNKKIDIKECSQYSMLFERFSIANARLQKCVDYDLRELGYPIKID